MFEPTRTTRLVAIATLALAGAMGCGPAGAGAPTHDGGVADGAPIGPATGGDGGDDAGDATGNTFRPGTPVFASAPMSIGDYMLGAPFDETFVPLNGTDGAPLFDNAEEHVRRTDLNSFEHSLTFVDNTLELSANATAWVVASADVSATSHRRYASYRAYQVEYSLSIDDTQVMQHARPAAGVYYLARIYYGHRYEMIFSGDERVFHAGVRARLTNASGTVQAFAASQGLDAQFRGRGMQPAAGDAIFAQNADDIQTGYTTSGPAVPIFVEYRPIPGAVLPTGAPVAWTQPASITLTHDEVDVFRNGNHLTNASWHLAFRCQIDGRTVVTDPDFWVNTDVTDSGSTGLTAPMMDTSTYAPYPINKVYTLEAVPGTRVECGFDGVQADASNRAIPFAAYHIDVADSNGDYDTRAGIGDTNTEYAVHYRAHFAR